MFEHVRNLLVNIKILQGDQLKTRSHLRILMKVMKNINYDTYMISVYVFQHHSLLRKF